MVMNEKIDVLAAIEQDMVVTRYRYGNPDQRINIESRDPDGDVWAIVNDGMCLNKNFEWEYEPTPSSRSDEFIERTRYTLDEAKVLLGIAVLKGTLDQ